MYMFEKLSKFYHKTHQRICNHLDCIYLVPKNDSDNQYRFCKDCNAIMLLDTDNKKKSYYHWNYVDGKIKIKLKDYHKPCDDFTAGTMGK